MEQAEEDQTHLSPVRVALRHWRRILAIWLIAALAWTPAVQLSSAQAGLSPGAALLAFLQTFVHFAPWALATPLFLGFSRRFPVGIGRRVPAVLVFVALGLAVIPAFTAIGVLLTRSLAVAGGNIPTGALFDGYGAAVLITGLFAVPTYAAAVGIGQTVAYLERDRARERLLSHARDAALRAQIAPHFLFNALNAISALGYRDPALADAALVRLSALLRSTLERPAWISLRDEVALVADYVELHRLLLGDRLDFGLAIAPGAWDARVPSMLLQPLIENALVHGLSRLPEGGTIRLEAGLSGDRLRIEVVNGAPAETGTSGTGTGLENVRRRLAAAYGDRAELVFARTDSGARVVLHLPFEALS
jgi:two-component system sensor histidine kinase AlgZ